MAADRHGITYAHDHLEARRRAVGGPVTLLTATRDLSLSQAAVLAELLRRDSQRPAGRRP